MNEKKKIFLLFIFIFGSLLFIPFDTFALSQTWAPYDVVIQIRQGNENVNTVINPPAYYSDSTLGHYYSWGDQYNGYTLPASIYFRYNNASNNLCGSNYGNVSGQFYAVQSFNTYTYEVQAENRNTKQRYGCSTTPNGHYMTFVCSGLDLTQNYNFVLNNIPRIQRYGLGERFEVYCINDTSSIINNNNYNADRIIENNNNNTNRLLDSQTESNDLLKNDDVTESNSSITNFFNNFNSGNNGGLTDIISLPLDFLNSLNNTCQPINVSIPYFNTNFTIPCLSTIYSQVIDSSLLNLIRLIINGLIMYRCIGSLVIFINDLRDPNNSDLEVMDL